LYTILICTYITTNKLLAI